ncbi:MAG: protein phosphatase 2C domain-containing protein [Geminicoccaceae bacterium]|nr:protein phosphatase 2C domain-containing protein [Geminicoccaceae bacterium]MDW8370737.1 protein phosphatase 2C domain-containing protein [Geminicoccaceae bacterium]
MSTDLFWRAAGASDVGKVRRVNEDAWLARPELALFAVADGLGGHARGDFASRTVVEELAGLSAETDLDRREAAVRAALGRAHGRIRAEAGRQGASIGTTVAALLARGGEAVGLWAGDSRIYRLREGRLEPLTRDHSTVQEMVDRGLLAPEEARLHPWRNRITRAVGTRPQLELERRTVELRAGDLVLLCTDGLTGPLEEKAIASLLVRHRLAAVGPLIAATLEHGAPDNVTVVVGELLVDPDRTVPGLGPAR